MLDIRTNTRMSDLQIAQVIRSLLEQPWGCQFQGVAEPASCRFYYEPASLPERFEKFGFLVVKDNFSGQPLNTRLIVKLEGGKEIEYSGANITHLLRQVIEQSPHLKL